MEVYDRASLRTILPNKIPGSLPPLPRLSLVRSLSLIVWVFCCCNKQTLFVLLINQYHQISPKCRFKGTDIILYKYTSMQYLLSPNHIRFGCQVCFVIKMEVAFKLLRQITCKIISEEQLCNCYVIFLLVFFRFHLNLSLLSKRLNDHC